MAHQSALSEVLASEHCKDFVLAIDRPSSSITLCQMLVQKAYTTNNLRCHISVAEPAEDSNVTVGIEPNSISW